jgi:hypothetical protein
MSVHEERPTWFEGADGTPIDLNRPSASATTTRPAGSGDYGMFCSTKSHTSRPLPWSKAFAV